MQYNLVFCVFHVFVSLAAHEFGVGPSEGEEDHDEDHESDGHNHRQINYTGPLYYAVSLYYTMEIIFTIG